MLKLQIIRFFPVKPLFSIRTGSQRQNNLLLGKAVDIMLTVNQQNKGFPLYTWKSNTKLLNSCNHTLLSVSRTCEHQKCNLVLYTQRSFWDSFVLRDKSLAVQIRIPAFFHCFSSTPALLSEVWKTIETSLSLIWKTMDFGGWKLGIESAAVVKRQLFTCSNNSLLTISCNFVAVKSI